MKKQFLIVLLAVALIAAFAGCRPGGSFTGSTYGGSAGGEERDERLKVVTTIFPPYDFTREIAGDMVQLEMLLSPGAESHSYDPTPQDILTIQNCDLFLYVGGESEVWVDRILASMDTTGMTLLSMMDVVDAVEEELVEGMEYGHDGDDNQGEDDEHEPELDEHVWTSPKNAAAIAEQITQALCTMDEVNAQAYRTRADAYLEELAALDAEFASMAAEAARTTMIFGDRFPFRYLADAYGLDYYAAFPGCSTETEASAATVAFLIDKVMDEGIPVVFHIELSNQQMADAICEATGAEKRLLHSVHNVSRDEFEAGESYLTLMRQNLVNLKKALLE